ncbi:MAG TPA: hypothetical protein VNQ56_01540 [Pseudolabrys sp.]|nr:hypothetical protein [Pseudolabrys sp.]
MSFRLIASATAFASALLIATSVGLPSSAEAAVAAAQNPALSHAASTNLIEQAQYRYDRRYRPHYRSPHWRPHRRCWTERRRVRTPHGHFVWRTVRRCR